MSEQYGKGFSSTNLGYFRQLFQVYADLIAIPHPAGGELTEHQKSYPPGSQFTHYCSPWRTSVVASQSRTVAR
ncbi:MAG: hypothetical protein NT163_10970 [Chlorobiales bacterium]|nr:hypothetical protein [Chlorobiales bacterium]